MPSTSPQTITLTDLRQTAFFYPQPKRFSRWKQARINMGKRNGGSIALDRG